MSEATKIEFGAIADPQTQKARGVYWLSRRNSGCVPPVAYWQDTAYGPVREEPKHGYPCFARPCPTVPRHGFVDSRVVCDATEAAAVFAEAKAADPNAEMMLMPLIEAHASAVVTPTWAAIGSGHDGATAGKAGTLAVQLLHTDIRSTPALIPEGQLPYLEVVFGRYQRNQSASFLGARSPSMPWLVQLRSGPAIGGQGAGNYIPRDTVVSEVLNAHDMDALTLEAHLNAADETGQLAGLVIWQANGNPCSHASCHARLHDIPIVFDIEAPAVGATLAKTGDTAEPMLDAEMANAVRYHGARASALPDEMSEAILWAIHQAPALARSVEGARFVAHACVQLWRYAATACIGEARHSNYVNGKRRRRTRSHHRHTIYARALAKAPTDAYMRSRVTMARAAFGLEENFSSGYGGSAWEGCARAALALYDALAALSAGKGSANDVVLAAHAVVNSAHNNGPFLNKFIGSEAFDLAAGGNQFHAIRGLESLFAYSRTTGADTAAGGPVWPQRKHKAPKAVNASHVRWCLRMEGTALHAQLSRKGKGAPYQSATLPLVSLPSQQIRDIVLAALFVQPDLQSLAKSSKAYWAADGVLSADTLKALFPNT